MWIAASKEKIEKNMGWCTDILYPKPGCLQFWEFIKIEPEKWVNHPMGDEGGGFWVVAIMGKKVIYYNDIEEGYNFSKFTTYGKIDEYLSGQSELYQLVESLYEMVTQ